MLRLVLRTSPYMEARARYTLEALCTIYCIPLTERADEASYTLYYGDPAGASDDLAGRDGGLLIPLAAQTEAFFTERRRFDPAGGVAWDKLRYLFGNGGEIERRGRWQVLPVDPIASAFYFLSAYQEWGSEAADPHGRYPAEDMLQVQWGIERTPLVDAYFAALVRLLPASLGIDPAPLIGHAPFMVALSHDIDYLYRGHGGTPLVQAWQVIGWVKNWLIGKAASEKVITALRGFSAYPNFNLEHIARLETEAGVRATYYLLPAYGVPERHCAIRMRLSYAHLPNSVIMAWTRVHSEFRGGLGMVGILGCQPCQDLRELGGVGGVGGGTSPQSEILTSLLATLQIGQFGQIGQIGQPSSQSKKPVFEKSPPPSRYSFGREMCHHRNTGWMKNRNICSDFDP
jgi:hypothetical protein